MTSNQIIPFSFENQPMRVTDQNGDPWFVLPDACTILGIRNSRDAASRLDDDEKADVGITDTSSNGVTQMRNVTIINESGLWSLVLTSRKPEAKRFKKWITAEVIPSIRKTGGYGNVRRSGAHRIDQQRENRLTMLMNIKLARMAGLVGNQALLSANRATVEMIGIDNLKLLGVTHMEAPQPEASLSPSDIAARGDFGSGRQANKMLTEAGFQTANRDHKGRLYYEPTPLGLKIGAVMVDTAKKHGDGTPVRQLRWPGSVVDRLRGAH